MYNQNHKNILNQVGELRKTIEVEILRLQDLDKEASTISKLVSQELFSKIDNIDIKTDTILNTLKK